MLQRWQQQASGDPTWVGGSMATGQFSSPSGPSHYGMAEPLPTTGLLGFEQQYMPTGSRYFNQLFLQADSLWNQVELARDELAIRYNSGALTPDELTEYQNFAFDLYMWIWSLPALPPLSVIGPPRGVPPPLPPPKGRQFAKTGGRAQLLGSPLASRQLGIGPGGIRARGGGGFQGGSSTSSGPSGGGSGSGTGLGTDLRGQFGPGAFSGDFGGSSPSGSTAGPSGAPAVYSPKVQVDSGTETLTKENPEADKSTGEQQGGTKNPQHKQSDDSRDDEPESDGKEKSKPQPAPPNPQPKQPLPVATPNPDGGDDEGPRRLPILLGAGGRVEMLVRPSANIAAVLARHGVYVGHEDDERGPPNPRARSSEARGDEFVAPNPTRARSTSERLRRDPRTRPAAFLEVLEGSDQTDYVINPYTFIYKPNPDDPNPPGPNARLRNPSIDASGLRVKSGRLI